MNEFIINLAQHVRTQLNQYLLENHARFITGLSPGGDTQFNIDDVAENAVKDFIKNHATMPFALYTEDSGFIKFADQPQYLLIIDPIDGTRPTSAGLEMGMISIALAPFKKDKILLSDVNMAVLMEIKNGAWIYGDLNGIKSSGFTQNIPHLSPNTQTDKMFWSIEFNGHPMSLMTAAYENLINDSANSGGVFIFNSASFSISRIITGQMDAYVDIGNRIYKDHPHTTSKFLEAGKGSILHLFPYDIAAAVFLAKLAGLAITDAYGNALDNTNLLDISPENQQSCIAACTHELHQQLLEKIRWDLPNISIN